MNWQHFQAFLWLRWRLQLNQIRRAGAVNAVILAILAVGALIVSAAMFIASWVVGLIVLPEASPAVLMYVWDGLVFAFIFSWAIGVIVELQRSEALSLQKFLHLPVSLTSAFLINYLSSFVSLTLIVFLPAMLGLSLALVFAKGPAMLLLLPLLAALVMAVTALTYQFQGWLASLMVNKRRRRTVIAVVTLVFVLFAQLPNLVVHGFIQPWKARPPDQHAEQLHREQTDLDRLLQAGKISPAEREQRAREIDNELRTRAADSNHQTEEQVEHVFRIVNLLLPPGWLPLAALAAAEGNVLPALLGTLGLAAIGGASLWRCYRTTVRLYTGQFSSGRKRAKAVATPPKGQKSAARLLEEKLPWISEQASAIALAGYRSLLRAPEVKLMLLGPLFVVVGFGTMLFLQALEVPEMLRPLMATGAIAMILLTMTQLIGNQFGFDRSGFRVFVLCAARRRDILLGKNLSFAPLALGMAAFVVVILECLYPMRIDHFFAAFPQMISMYLLYCLLANGLSIFAPMPIAAGSLRPTNPNFIAVLLQMLLLVVCPPVFASTLLPLAIEALFAWLTGIEGAPLCLVLSLLELGVIAYLYSLILTWQSDIYHAREQKILEVVTTKVE